MTIATVRSIATHVFLPATLGGLVLLGCTPDDGDDVKSYFEDDDVKNFTVDDDSLEPVGAHRGVLKTDDTPPTGKSIYTDAILAIAIAEEGKGPEEVGVSTGYPLSDYTDDITGGWCSEFVSWAYWRGGCPFSDWWGEYPWMIGGSTQIRDWFIEYSRFVYQTDPEWETFVPQPGDYIRYNTSGGGHSGIVRYVEGTTLYTVEGNVNNIVMLRSFRDYKTDYSDPVNGIDGFGVNPCGDAGAGGAAGSGGAGGEPATGGAGGDTTTGGAGGSAGSGTPGTGGETGTGGAVIGSGGAGVGGSIVGSGGAGVGGSIVGSGGTGVGGYSPGSGGAVIGSGGAAIGSGGAGVGGATVGSGGAGLGGYTPGAGGAPVGAGGTPVGAGGTPVGAGGTPVGAGGAPVGAGGTATGGNTVDPLAATGGQPGIAGPGGTSGDASNDEDSGDESGCSCTVPAGSRGGATRTPWSALGLLGLLFVRRRRSA